MRKREEAEKKKEKRKEEEKRRRKRGAIVWRGFVILLFGLFGVVVDSVFDVFCTF
jgi:hypothetical protein